MPFYTFTKGEAGEGVSEEREREAKANRSSEIHSRSDIGGFGLYAVSALGATNYLSTKQQTPTSIEANRTKRYER